MNHISFDIYKIGPEMNFNPDFDRLGATNFGFTLEGLGNLCFTLKESILMKKITIKLIKTHTAQYEFSNQFDELDKEGQFWTLANMIKRCNRLEIYDYTYETNIL